MTAVKKERLAGAGVLAALGAFLLLNLLFVARDCDRVRPPMAGAPAQPFDVVRVDRPAEHATLAGLMAAKKVILIDFWASWCGPCEQTMPMLSRLWTKHHAEGLELLSINLDDAPRTIAAYRQSHELPFEVYRDATGRMASDYRVGAIPHMVLIDQQGVIRLVHIGAFRLGALEEELDGKIRQLLAQ